MAKYKRQKVKRYHRSFYSRTARIKRGVGIVVLVLAVLGAAWLAAPHVLDWATHTWYTVVKNRDLEAESASRAASSEAAASSAAAEAASSQAASEPAEPELDGKAITGGSWAEVDVTTLTDEAAIRSAARQLKAQGMTYAILTLKDTAAQLGVSSTPIREAFQMLAREGLIELRPNRGAIVLGMNEKRLRDHYETRAALERAAVVLVCRKKADIAPVKLAYIQAASALAQNDSAGYSAQNQAFHMAIWTAADNDAMKELLSSLWNGLSMGHKVTQEHYAEISMNEHYKILDALKARDEVLAGNLMESHIMRSLENVLTHLRAE